MSPPRIAFLIHDLNSWGGQDRSTLEIARRLAPEFDVEAHAFTLNLAEKAAGSERISFRPVPATVRRPVWLKSLWYQLATGWRFHGAARGDRLLHSTGTCSWRADWIHLQFLHTAWREAERALDREWPLSGWRHAYARAKSDYECALERLLFTPEKTYIALSHGVAKDLRRLFGQPPKIHVIPHGVDSDHFAPLASESRARLRQELGVPAHGNLILFVGEYRRKGLHVAIRALAALPSELRRQTRLLAVGNGDREAYAALARREGVSDSVFLRPHERETRGFYQAADAFVLPSFYEPFGLVALEAAACACPPVLSACTGAAELFTPGQSALTVENPGDTAGFTRALTDLLVDPARAQAMGLQARAVALRRGWDQVARDYRARLMELG